jgi:hypothetical protein
MTSAEETRAFVLGAVFDFVMHMLKRDPAIIVGVGYPRDKFIQDFETWAAERGLTLDKIKVDDFRKACELKMLG